MLSVSNLYFYIWCIQYLLEWVIWWLLFYDETFKSPPTPMIGINWVTPRVDNPGSQLIKFWVYSKQTRSFSANDKDEIDLPGIRVNGWDVEGIAVDRTRRGCHWASQALFLEPRPTRFDSPSTSLLLWIAIWSQQQRPSAPEDKHSVSHPHYEHLLLGEGCVGLPSVEGRAARNGYKILHKGMEYHLSHTLLVKT